MFSRLAASRVKVALADTPVVFLMGPRQCGKTTLVKSLIDDASGDCFGVEVKAAATLTARDFTGLRRLQSVAGSRFKLGVLLYDGDHTTAFGNDLFAVPIGAVWS